MRLCERRRGVRVKDKKTGRSIAALFCCTQLEARYDSKCFLVERRVQNWPTLLDLLLPFPLLLPKSPGLRLEGAYSALHVLVSWKSRACRLITRDRALPVPVLPSCTFVTCCCPGTFSSPVPRLTLHFPLALARYLNLNGP